MCALNGAPHLVESSMKVLATVATGVAIASAAASASVAQVRTLGPAAPYLMTGRSVAVPQTTQAQAVNEQSSAEPSAPIAERPAQGDAVETSAR